MDMESELEIISYNIRGFGADKFGTVKDLLKICDFLFLQEIWAYESIFINTVKKDFPGYECIVKSPNSEEDRKTKGRLNGGVSILYKSNINCKAEEVKSNSSRVCALRIVIDKVDIILINVYMPCDPGVLDGELAEYNDVLIELKRLIICSSSHHVIISGDLNTDLVRNNAQTKALLSFVNEEKMCLCITHDISNVPYTHIPIRGEYSTIDHALTTLNLCNAVSSYESHFMHNNFSDHVPIYLKLNISVSYSQVKENVIPAKTNWRKCTVNDVENYKTFVDNELSKIEYDHNAMVCQNVQCKIHTEHLNYVYDRIIEICKDSSDQYLPKSGQPKTGNREIPGWNEYVKPFHDKSLFWHDIWVQCGRPRHREVSRIMRMTRAKYHYAVRSLLKEQIKIRNDKMAEAISSDNDRNLWEEVSKMKKSHKLLPDVIDNIKGSNNISKLFFDKNKELFNSVSFEDTKMKELQDEINKLIDNAHDHNTNVNLIKFTIQDVIDVINELKLGKSEESGLFTDHFRHAPHRLFVLLTCLFNSMLVHGNAPNNMLVGTMTPIIKNNRESHNKSSNYRTLTIGTSLSKVFDLLIIKKQNKVFNTSELQFGFKNNSSTTLCTFMVQQTISHYVANGSNVNVLMLDASKAFDRVHYITLFKKLIARNLCPLAIRLLLNMYTQQKLQVKWNGSISDQFSVSNGVRQGGVMSPLLFGIYIDDLLLELKNNGVGCHIGNYYCGAYGYADDIILLCPSITGLERMIQICEIYSDKHCISFNGKKSKLLIFGKKGNDPNIIIKGENVPVCTKAIYLGNLLSTLNEDDMTNEGIKIFNVNFNIFMSEFSTCRILVKNKLFNQYCCFYYGSQLWPLYNNSFNDVCTKWRKAVRRIWNLPYNTHCGLLPLVSEQCPIEISLNCRFVKNLKTLLNSDNSTVSYIARVQSQNCRSIFGQNIRHIIVTNDLSWYEMDKYTTNAIKKHLNNKYMSNLNDNYITYAGIIRDVVLDESLNIFLT